MAQQAKVYLDEQGNPITGKVYLTDQGETTAQAAAGPRTPPQAAAQPPFNPPRLSLMEMPNTSLLPGLSAQQASDLGKGFLKGAARTAIGAGELIAPALRQIPGVQDYVATPEQFDQARSAFTTPTNTSQRVGKGAETVLEFALPASKLAKIKTALTTGSGILNALVSAGVEGASAAGVSSVQRGTTKGALTTGAVAAAVPLALQGASKPLGWLGERIERALLKPTKAASEGLTPSQLVSKVYQYKVGGTLSQTYDKTQKAIEQTSQQLESVLKAQPQANVDVVAAFVNTADDIKRGAMRTVGTNEELDRALAKISRELSTVVPSTGTVNLVEANEIKKGIGDLGAWTRNPQTGRVQLDPEANAIADVADRLYGHLKTAIEANAPRGTVAALNRRLSDLITIRRAVVHRIPVAERANVLNLGDLLGLSSGTFWVSVANRLLQSGRVANAAVSASRGVPVVAPLAGRVAAAGISSGQE